MLIILFIFFICALYFIGQILYIRYKINKRDKIYFGKYKKIRTTAK